jgi:CheY-like chemotaxis protein
VLVVDDDADTVEVLSLALVAYCGWDVQAVTTGARALEICWSSPLDVVLLDVEMPVMDGPGVLAALRGDPRTTSLPVVFVTALADPVVNSRLHALGATAVLPKPFDPVRIGDQVAAFLGLPPSSVDLGTRRGQRYLEDAAPVRRGLGPDAPAVRFDDPAGDGQA